jgi:hypothetical protein
MKLLIMQSSPISRHFLPFRSKYSPQHLFSNTINLCSSLSVRDQVSNPYRTTGKIMILYILILNSRDSSVGIVTKLGAGRSGSDSRQSLGIFLFATASRLDLWPTQPPTQWVAGALSPGVKQTGCEADHSPPSSSEVKNAWSYTATHRIRLHSVVLN